MINKIIKTTKKDDSFYILKMNYNNHYYAYYTEIMEMKILNLDKDIKVDVNFSKIKNFNSYADLLVLSINKNIIINSNNLHLYNDLFDKNKLIFSQYFNIFQSLKINDNTFVFSVYKNKEDLSTNIWIMKIEDDLVEKNIIENYGPYFIYYNNDKKILFSLYNNKIYLTNFNTILPEIIQIIETNYTDIRYNSSIKYLNNFSDDTIFFITKNNDSKFYEVEYIVQYKIIKDELKEIFRIELSSKQIKDI